MTASIDFSVLDRELTAFFDTEPAIAFALQVVDSGHVLYEFTHGVDTEGNSTASTTLFPSCSSGKVITGITLLRLVEDGVLALDLPVTKYIPWLRFPGQQSANEVTLRHLLSHTSGLSSDPDFPEILFSGKSTALEQHVREDIPKLAVAASPGEVLWYSNAGFSIAGVIAQTTTDELFCELAEHYVLSQLRMDRTSFIPGTLKGLPRVGFDHRKERPIPINYPAGGALSCARDFGRLAQAMLSQANGSNSLLAPETFDEMTTVRGDGYCGEPRRYGLACDIERYRGSTLLTHGGGGFGCGSVFATWPDAGIGVVALFNNPKGYAFGHRRVFELLGSFDDNCPDATSTQVSLPTFGGDYMSPLPDLGMGPETLHIESRGDHLVLDDGKDTRGFIANDEGVFESDRRGETLGFTPDGKFAMYDAFGIGLVSVLPYRRLTEP